MGVYDRDYYRDDEPKGYHLSTGRSMIVTLIIINAVVFLAGLFTSKQGVDWLTDNYLALRPDSLAKPWMWWQFVTTGFSHAGIQHILFNMFGLWVFGSELENRYGRWETLRIYLTAAVLGAVVWAARNYFLPTANLSVLVGASGAVFAFGTLFILNFPNRTLLFMFVLPMKAWVLGVIYLVGLFFGLQSMAMDGQVSTAHDVHLVGLLFGLGYFFFHWNLGRLTPTGWLDRLRLTWRRMKPGAPNLRVHAPERDDRYHDLDEQADLLLEKVHQKGEASLTDKERRLLQEYSRRMRQKRG
jgi:membrane associated rhomboid family serine protease